MTTPSSTPNAVASSGTAPKRANPGSAATPRNMHTPIPSNTSPRGPSHAPGSASAGHLNVWTPSAANLGGNTPSGHLTGATPSALLTATPLAGLAATPATAASPARFSLGGKTPMTALRAGTPLPRSGAATASPANMSTTLSGLGLSLRGEQGRGSVKAGTSHAPDSAERRRRLEAVLAALQGRHGHVGREGMERLARRFGMEVLWEDGRQGKGTLSLAGGVMVCDVSAPDRCIYRLQFATWEDDEGDEAEYRLMRRNDQVELNTATPSGVSRVALSFPGSSDAVASHAQDASRLLLHNLSPPATEGHGSTTVAAATTLDAFADNLSRLANMDKLSSPGANCFEAVMGVYTALRRLFEHEKSLVQELAAQTQTQQADDMSVEVEVLCKRSGRPRVHARGRVGLALDYWMDERLVRRDTHVKLDPDADTMDTTEDGQADNTADTSPNVSNQTYSLVIETEQSLPALFPSIRITDDWLSIADAPADPDNHQPATPTSRVTWHDPPTLLAPPSTTTAPHHASTDLSPPAARFVAKLEPPLALPAHLAAHLLASLGVETDPATTAAEDQPSYASLVLGAAARPHDPSAPLSRTRAIPRPAPNTNDASTSTNPNTPCTLTLHHPAGGGASQTPARLVDRLPFAHPRQLLALLPTLRQWVVCAALLRRSFAPDAAPHTEAGADTDPEAHLQTDDRRLLEMLLAPHEPQRADINMDAHADADVHSNDSHARTNGTHAPAAPPPPRLHVDITFSPHGAAPRFSVAAPLARATGGGAVGGGVARAVFTVGLDGVVDVLAADGFVPLNRKGGDTRGDANEVPGPGQEIKTETETGVEARQGVKAEAGAEAHARTRAGLARALAVCEDWGVWGVWVAGRFGFGLGGDGSEGRGYDEVVVLGGRGDGKMRGGVKDDDGRRDDTTRRDEEG